MEEFVPREHRFRVIKVQDFRVQLVLFNYIGCVDTVFTLLRHLCPEGYVHTHVVTRWLIVLGGIII